MATFQSIEVTAGTETQHSIETAVQIENIRQRLNQKLYEVQNLPLKRVKRKRIVSTHGRDEIDESTGLYLSGTDDSYGGFGPEKEPPKLQDPSMLTLILRATTLCFNFAPCMSTCVLAYISDTFRNGIWFDMVQKSLARSGPAFIKWGQWASTRADMFPEQLCIALSKLHANAPEHKWSYTKSQVEESLEIPKGSLLQVFESFDRKPIASGSIAQIHKARLPCSATTTTTKNKQPQCNPLSASQIVAVKVRHPQVAELIDRDFRIMRSLATFIDSIPSLRWLNVGSSVEQFSHTMAAQAHLDVEAHHLDILNDNFRSWKHVGFPKPIFATSSIIIETFEQGEIIGSILDAHDQQKKQPNNMDGDEGLSNDSGSIPKDMAQFIVTNGVGLYMKMLLVDNLMHADLHPGNIMVFSMEKKSSLKRKRRSPMSSSLVSSNQRTTAEVSTALATISHPYNINTHEKDMDFDNMDPMIHYKGSNGEAKHLYRGHITLVDAGMVAELDAEESMNFIGLLAAMGEGDGVQAANSVLLFSETQALNDEEKDAFRIDMVELFQERCRGYGEGIDVGDVLRGVLNLVRVHHIPIDANYATLVVNALCIESLAKRVYPKYNVLDASRPLLQSYSRMCVNGKCLQSKVCHVIYHFISPAAHYYIASHPLHFNSLLSLLIAHSDVLQLSPLSLILLE